MIFLGLLILISLLTIFTPLSWTFLWACVGLGSIALGLLNKLQES